MIPSVYCLTLPEEPWKKAEAARALAGLPVTFVNGFHGMLMGLRPTNPFQFDKDGTPEFIHIAQAGCCLSHILMLKIALAMAHEEFICCEDDVQLCEDFPGRWAAARKTLPDAIGLVQLEYVTADPSQPAEEISPGIVTRPCYGHRAGAIWWRRSAAEMAERLLRPVDGPYDIMLMRKVYPFVGHGMTTVPLARQRTAVGEWPSSIGLNVGRRDVSNEGIPSSCLTN